MIQRFLDIIQGYNEQHDSFLTSCETPAKAPLFAHISNPWNGIEWDKEISGGLVSLPPAELENFKAAVLRAAEEGDDNVSLKGPTGWIARALEINSHDQIAIATRSALSWVNALTGPQTPEQGDGLTEDASEVGVSGPENPPEI